MSWLSLIAAGVRILRQPADQRRLALEAGLQLTRASIEFRVLPFSRTASMLGTLQTRDPDSPAGAEQLREAARVGATAARVARRLPWGPTCLRQALAVQRMLRRRRIPSRLHLGVTSPSVGEAHAWVTVDGRPVVGGAGVERYVPLAAFG